jgi:hypothetical protein
MWRIGSGNQTGGFIKFSKLAGTIIEDSIPKKGGILFFILFTYLLVLLLLFIIKKVET